MRLLSNMGVPTTANQYTSNSWYGVTWDEIADTYVRTGATAGETCGVTLSDALQRVSQGAPGSHARKSSDARCDPDRSEAGMNRR